MPPGAAPTALAVLGTASHVGKSWLVTALARWLARQGVAVTVFKAQNMSNHARVALGGEIGSAQYYQALAARQRPIVWNNPILLKPEAETRSQVVVLGQPRPDLQALPWHERARRLRPVVQRSLAHLTATGAQVVLLEGAGSPTEINLMATDVVNLYPARLLNANLLLVADIDRGGAFAHLYGTWAMLPPEDRARVRGFVLNKFRGDPALLHPAAQQIFEWTGVPVVGVLPYVPHALPDEDAPYLGYRPAPPASGPEVVILTYPYASNLDEFWPWPHWATVRFTRSAEDVRRARWLVLPGAKNVGAALDWLHGTGMADAVRAAAARGARVLGICGGLQILGQRVLDPHGLEFGGERPGLGLLPLVTVFRPPKQVRWTRARFARLDPPWHRLSGLSVAGYEIHFGETYPVGPVREVLSPRLGYQKDNILGLYIHGLLEQPDVQRALGAPHPIDLEATFNALADAIDAHVDTRWLHAWLQGPTPAPKHSPLA